MRSRLGAMGGTAQPAPGPGAAWPGQAVPVRDDAPVPPALVNVVLTGCKPSFAAYHATILDLAARGFLTVTSQPDDVWLGCLAAAAAPADTADLADYEQLVLADMNRRLAGTGGAPFRALAEACQADEQHVWLPFTEALREEARRRGLSQPRRVRRPMAGAVTLAAVALLFAILTAILRLPLAASAAFSVFLPLIILVIVVGADRRDQLTPYGTQLAARVAGERGALVSAPATQGLAAPADAELGRRAVAVAAMIPGAGPGRSAPSRHRGPAAQTEAWSAFSGTWRLVKIGPPPRDRVIPIPGIVALAFAAFFALLAITLAVESGTGLWSLPFVLAAIALGIRGMASLSATLSLPRRKTFTGQVIARWGDAGKDEDPYCAIDDGERAWTFTAPAVCYVMLDDLVQVALNPRTGRLITLQVTERLRQDDPGHLPVPGYGAAQRPGSPACPVSAAEVEPLIGPVQRSTPMPVLGGHGVLYQGQNGRADVIVVSGGLARLSTMISRSAGTPLPGTGAEFWLVNGGRTVAVRSAGTVAKVTVSGRGAPSRPDLLTELAAKIAARLEPAGPRDPRTDA
jgi:hypothetical protein